MAQLYLLRQLALFKMHPSLQGITKYNLYHIHVTEVKGKKNYEKSQIETRLWRNGTIKEKNILRKETSEGYDKY